MSRGVGCAWANRPGIYTLVENYVGWINKIISDGQCEKPVEPKKSENYPENANQEDPKTNSKSKHKTSPVRGEDKFDLEA